MYSSNFKAISPAQLCLEHAVQVHGDFQGLVLNRVWWPGVPADAGAASGLAGPAFSAAAFLDRPAPPRGFGSLAGSAPTATGSQVRTVRQANNNGIRAFIMMFQPHRISASHNRSSLFVGYASPIVLPIQQMPNQKGPGQAATDY